MKRSQVLSCSNRRKKMGVANNALYVVIHAMFQRSRGKNPSEPYKGERNPFKALKLAIVELRTFNPRCGGHIPTMIVEMVEISKRTKQEVTGKFNGVSVTATPKSSPEALADWWSKEMDRQVEEYCNSDESKNIEREYREREERRQAMLLKELSESPTTITLKDEEGWKKLMELNKECIGIMNYAERWARLMEGWLAKGGTLR
jgi:hypothetical protein